MEKSGVVFGPQPRTRMLSIHVQQKRLVFNIFLFQCLIEMLLLVWFELKGSKPSAKGAHDVLHSMGLLDKKVVLFLPFGDELTAASFRNFAKC
jgi:hypothetical protein